MVQIVEYQNWQFLQPDKLPKRVDMLVFALLIYFVCTTAWHSMMPPVSPVILPPDHPIKFSAVEDGRGSQRHSSKRGMPSLQVMPPRNITFEVPPEKIRQEEEALGELQEEMLLKEIAFEQGPLEEEPPEEGSPGEPPGKGPSEEKLQEEESPEEGPPQEEEPPEGGSPGEPPGKGPSEEKLQEDKSPEEGPPQEEEPPEGGSPGEPPEGGSPGEPMPQEEEPPQDKKPAEGELEGREATEQEPPGIGVPEKSALTIEVILRLRLPIAELRGFLGGKPSGNNSIKEANGNGAKERFTNEKIGQSTDTTIKKKAAETINISSIWEKNTK
ncbi:unnamed protein product [Cylicocyclus nassatus]|uniref:Uncharacterized protein n=1 Tax=Cylicocyclus nassatus TaxID=53992 RepID=A0AA36H9Y4_CYLNA|nr:unnamed protein product [Cylicocyclus nassatus]